MCLEKQYNLKTNNVVVHKPWITPANFFKIILEVTILTKKNLQKIFEQTHIKFHAKRIYDENLIKSNSNNSNQTWLIIKKIIDCKQFSKKSKLPSELSVDNEMINSKFPIFLDKLCDYFANIGATMSKNIPNEKNSVFKIHDKSCSQSFAF